MKNHQVVVKSKQWFRYFMYGCGILGSGMGAFNAYQMWSSPSTMSKMENGDFAFILIFCASILMAILMPIVIPQFYKLKLVFHKDGIKQHALSTKNIRYEEIEKIKIMNGHIEVRGTSFFDRITFGNLYTNFDTAVAFLANHTAERNDISFKGSEKYIDEYFSR